MRVLFGAVPAIGHLFPLVPLAWALRADGHEVAVASLDGAEVLTRAGLPLVNVAPGVAMYEEVLGKAGARRPDLLERTRTSMGADRDAFVRLFAAFNDRIAEGFLEAASKWRPDLVVHEYLFPVGRLAAARLDVPSVQLDIGFTRISPLRDAMLEELSKTYEKFSLPVPQGPFDAIHTVPPSMAMAGLPARAMRPVPYDGGQLLPDWLRERPSRPRVAVTLGTVSPVMSGVERVRGVVAVAERTDAEFVLAMGDTDLSELGTLPDNVRDAGWVSWRALLATSSAAIHHGGSGTTLTALDAGVPQLLLPDGSDRHINTEAVLARGAGITAPDGKVTDHLIAELLGDDKIRAAATEVATEIAAMPTPTSVAKALTN